jgi:hypothetical protein
MDRPFENPTSMLPNLPPRGELKFDHLSFREPGKTSAKNRAANLRAKIDALVLEEQSAKDKLDKFRQRCLDRTDVEEAERAQFQLKMLQHQDVEEELKRLCSNVEERFQECKQALAQALTQKKATIKSNTLEEVLDGVEENEKRQKMEMLRQDVLRHDLNTLQTELEEVQADLKRLQKGVDPNRGEITSVQINGEYNNGRTSESERQVNGHKSDSAIELNAGRISAKGESDEGNIVLQEGQEKLDHEANGLLAQLTCDQSDKNGHWSDEGGRDGEEATVDDDDANPGEGGRSLGGQDPDVGKNHSGEKQSKSQEDKERLVEEQRIRAQRRRELQTKKGQLTSQIQSKGLEVQRSKKYCVALAADLDSLQEKKRQLEKEMLEENRRDHEKEHDKQSHEKELNDKKKEFEELEKDFKRQDALADVTLLHNKKMSGSKTDSGSSRRQGLSRSTSSAVGAEMEERRQLDLIKKVIDAVATLEEQVKKIRYLREKVERMADIRITFEREYDLERRWLDHVSNPIAMGSIADPASNGRDHFASAIPDNLIIYSERLQKGKIRLLILLPAQEAYYPLLCKLETGEWGSQSNQSKLSYAALSYFWGPDICNGRLYLIQGAHARDMNLLDNWGHAAKHATRIPIRNNLFRALLRLRRRDRVVALWVDALCINQEDMMEKTDQLAQMANVYSKAENVCVWLGESDVEERSDRAMKFIRDIMDFAVLDRYARDKKQAKMWYALAELMRDRWFSRRWVVQEISLALDRATIHCGGEMVQWSDFADAVSLLASNQDVIKNLFDYSEWRDGPNTLGDVQSFGAYILLEATSKLFLTTTQGDTAEVKITKPIKTLESLVTSLKTFDVSDPRDLVYSLVSIASDTSQSADIHLQKRAKKATREQQVSLEVDYGEKKAIDVYRDFTRFCIQISGSLDIICRPWAMPINEKGVATVAQELPSWILPLSTSEFGEPEDVYTGRKNGDNLIGAVDHPRYKASGNTSYMGRNHQRTSPPQWPNVDTPGHERTLRYEALDDPICGQCLRVRGFRLAKIQKVSARNTGGVILRESLEMGSWKGIKRNASRVPDKIWRTLVADRDPDGQFPPTWYQRACLRCLEIADTFNNGDLNVGELLQGHSDMLRKYLTRVRNVTWNRTFFDASIKDVDSKETEADHSLFGLGPPGTKQGDFVCILFGCTVPVILREVNTGDMVVVGEAYIHGKMEGEAIDDLDSGETWGTNEETFQLR